MVIFEYIKKILQFIEETDTWPFVVMLMMLIVFFVIKDIRYKSGAYYKITKNSYFKIARDKGKHGEYLTYKYLRHMEGYGAKFLFNAYIPKPDGTTTEIDVLMICPKGIFVFESKNYSGWIFGDESRATWYQTLPRGRGRSHKEHFLNPLMQNGEHIKHLQRYVDGDIPIRSVIVFSDRCKLKNVQIQSKNVFVINRYDIAYVIASFYDHNPTVLQKEEILKIYDDLYPFTQVEEKVKEAHVANIRNKRNGRRVRRVQCVPTNDCTNAKYHQSAQEQKKTPLKME